MTIERQIEAIKIAEIKLYKPIASSVISTRSLHINCLSAAYYELKEFNKQGFSTVVYGAQFDDCCDMGIVLSILDMQEPCKEIGAGLAEETEEPGKCKEIGAGLAEETEEPGKSDSREAWHELGNDFLEVMEELGRDIKEME